MGELASAALAAVFESSDTPPEAKYQLAEVLPRHRAALAVNLDLVVAASCGCCGLLRSADRELAERKAVACFVAACGRPQAAFAAACAVGELRSVEWLLRRFPHLRDFVNAETLVCCCRSGNLALVQWVIKTFQFEPAQFLESHTIPASMVPGLDQAITNYNAHVAAGEALGPEEAQQFARLVEERKVPVFPVFRAACEAEALDVAQWLLEWAGARPDEQSYLGLLGLLCEKGKINAVRWLLATGQVSEAAFRSRVAAPPHDFGQLGLFIRACYSGDGATIRWLAEQLLPEQRAAAFGEACGICDVPTLRWLAEGCASPRLNGWACERACMRYDLATLRWLAATCAPVRLSSRIFAVACKREDVSIVEFASSLVDRANLHPGMIRHIFRGACRRNNVVLMAWLYREFRAAIATLNFSGGDDSWPDAGAWAIDIGWLVDESGDLAGDDVSFPEHGERLFSAHLATLQWLEDNLRAISRLAPDAVLRMIYCSRFAPVEAMDWLFRLRGYSAKDAAAAAKRQIFQSVCRNHDDPGFARFVVELFALRPRTVTAKMFQAFRVACGLRGEGTARWLLRTYGTPALVKALADTQGADLLKHVCSQERFLVRERFEFAGWLARQLGLTEVHARAKNNLILRNFVESNNFLMLVWLVDFFGLSKADILLDEGKVFLHIYARAELSILRWLVARLDLRPGDLAALRAALAKARPVDPRNKAWPRATFDSNSQTPDAMSKK
jgi:hypothetical protein